MERENLLMLVDMLQVFAKRGDYEKVKQLAIEIVQHLESPPMWNK